MMNKKVLTTALLWLMALVVNANDGVYYVSGNQIVPLKETDVAVSKEILTITMGNDAFARVDVQYEFINRGQAKTIDVGFEAMAPYEPGEVTFNKSGKHPEIFDFTVEMNGEVLPIRNFVVKQGGENETTDFVPLDLRVWTPDEDATNGLKKKGKDEYINYSYAYCFKATFKEGRNVVHHTYRYRMSSAIYESFSIPYWLMPAMRWANHQIDDFTLRIKTDNVTKHFCMAVDNTWMAHPWKLTSGTGKIRKVHSEWGGGNDYMEFVLRNGTYEWHANNFRPTQNISIVSPECLTFNNPSGFKLGMFYDQGTMIVVPFELIGEDGGKKMKNGSTDGIPNKQIIRNLPYANRGYVFKNPKLKAYFSKIWWYMPDPTWNGDTSSFTETDWMLINENK